jgi:hypothetical protein
MENYINEKIEFIMSAQSKAKLNKLIAANFIERRIDDLIILDELQEDPAAFEGEGNKVNVRTK